MVLALTILLAAAQASPIQQSVIRPSGISGELHSVCDSIEQAMAAGDFEKADRLMGLFPKEQVTYQWDDSKVPEIYREAYAKARDRAFEMWQSRFHHLTLTAGSNPDIKFSFEPVLAKSPDGDAPQTLAMFFSKNPGTTRLEAVIGIKRGNPPLTSNETDVHNEVLYAVGSYLGLGRAPAFGTAMGHTDQSTNYRTEVVARESMAALGVYDMGGLYRQGIKAKKAISTAPPKFFTDTARIELGKVLQGGIVPATVQISNTGTGPMTYSMMPDCGCIRVSPSGILKPGASTLVRADFDSTQFVGDLHKQVFIMTNDPDKPMITIPVHVNVQPTYRFIRPEGQVLVMNGKTAHAEVYLTLPDGSDIIPTEYRIDGIDGVATAEDWKGTIPDPELNEGPKERSGFKVKLDFSGAMPPGRSSATLVVKTSNPKFESIRYTIYLQKGIVVLPTSIFLGSMTSAPKTLKFLVSRPGKPFKILGIDTASQNLSIVSTKANDAKDEYTVELTYDGKAGSGEFLSSLTVKTDDSSQPKIEVPVTGTMG